MSAFQPPPNDWEVVSPDDPRLDCLPERPLFLTPKLKWKLSLNYTKGECIGSVCRKKFIYALPIQAKIKPIQSQAPTDPKSEATKAINDLAADVYRNACDKGFHDDDSNRSTVENFGIWTANLHGEVSELWEAARKGHLHQLCDKKGSGLTNEEEELADIIIRAFDTATARGIDIGNAILKKHAYNKTRPHRHGGKLA